jgi:hypothetical protein
VLATHSPQTHRRAPSPRRSSSVYTISPGYLHRGVSPSHAPTSCQPRDRLGENQEAVRQELTRAYRILVPDEAEGDDRRTQAVLTYVRLTREEHWDAP